MDKTIEIYKNYGCLASEKRCRYTFGAEHSTAACSEKLTVRIPDGWDWYENEYGCTILQAPNGFSYKVDEVLFGDAYPYFMTFDRDGKERRERLEVVDG